MKYLTKKDFIHIICYSICSLLYGMLNVSDIVQEYYCFSAYSTDMNMMLLVFQAIWLMPKLLAISFLLQEFVDVYENCYIYYKIRDSKNKLWLKQMLKNLLLKLISFSLGKAIFVFVIVRDISIPYILYETNYLFLFTILNIILFFLTKNTKSILVFTIVLLTVFQIIVLRNIILLKDYLFMENITWISIVVTLFMSFVFVIGLSNVLETSTEEAR